MNKRLIKSNDDAAGGASFNTVLWTGNGTTNPITGVGFQPDFVWTKSRSVIADNNVVDSVRGLGDNVLKALSTNLTDAENTTTSNNVSSLDLDGFTIQGAGSRTNAIGVDYVAWCWKAGGAAVTNTDGTITSQVSANTEAGFSIVSYTGNGITGTIGHGLSSAPSMLIIKNRSLSTNWVVGSNEIGWNYSLNLNDTSAAGLSTNRFNATSPTSSVFSVGATSVSNGSGNSMIAYCFAEVAGFSKFGSYTGNGNVNGPVVSTSVDGDAGFEPAFVMIKCSSKVGDSSTHWVIKDNKRDTTNPNSANLYANLSNAEDNITTADVNFLLNGFQPAGTFDGINESGQTYIYMAFANQF